MVVNITPSSTGSFKSNCQTASIHTNLPGYTLTARSTGSNPNYNSGAITNNLLYLNPTTITPTPTIPSTTNTTTTPSTLTNNTWGFAVEALNSTDTPSNQASTTFSFDSYYTIDNPNNTYAELPTSDTTIYSTDQFPITVTDHTFYYAARLTPDTVAGSYATTVTYTAIGEIIPEVIYYPKVINGASFQDTTYKLDETCSALPIYDSTNPDPNSTVIMTDERNGQDYRVRRLQDGRCWMIDNLKLADVTLTSADSNVLVDYYLVQIGTRGTSDDTPYVDDPAINSPYKDYCINNTADSSIFTESYSSDSKTGCGYLYSWSAATAGTGNGISTDGENATGSICPVGWHLPTGSSTGEFAVLNGSMLNGLPSAADITSDPDTRVNWFSTGSFSGSYAGDFNGSNWYRQGNSGSWWSSTALTATGAYAARIYYNSLGPGSNTHNQTNSFAVRCLL